MSSIDDIFSGDSLKADDIKGREPTVTIKHVEPKVFTNNGKDQKKLIISFQGAKKTLVCNRTNAQRIAYIHGKDYMKWIGKQITLFVDPFVEYQGEIKPAIRVKPPANAQAARVPKPAPETIDEIDPPPVTDMDDEIPF